MSPLEKIYRCVACNKGECPKNTKHVVRDLVLQTTLGGDTREATSHIPIQCGESFYATPFDCLGLLGRHERVPEEEQGPQQIRPECLGVRERGSN